MKVHSWEKKKKNLNSWSTYLLLGETIMPLPIPDSLIKCSPDGSLIVLVDQPPGTKMGSWVHFVHLRCLQVHLLLFLLPTSK